MNDKKKIKEKISEAIIDDGKFPNMSYEEGVRAALEWVLDNCSDEKDPMNE